MTVGGGFRRLTRVLRHLERAGWTIEDVRPSEGEGLRVGTGVGAALICRSDAADRAVVAGNGDEPSSITDLVREAGPAEVTTIDVTRDRAGAELVRVHVHIPADDEAAGEDGPAGVPTDRDEPPLHRNPRLLASLYGEHASFVEMASAVDAEVSAETIRRYMIEHGIHEPGSGGPHEEPSASGPILADGHGLAGTVEHDALVRAVEGANTLYDVQRRLGLDREQTTSLLSELDLLDLVQGRLETAPNRDVRRETIERRLGRTRGD